MENHKFRKDLQSILLSAFDIRRSSFDFVGFSHRLLDGPATFIDIMKKPICKQIKGVR